MIIPKKALWDRMTGHVPELNDPANVDGMINIYPNAVNDGSCNLIEPSIRGRQLYIPIDAWFCGTGKMALPLVSLQYQEVFIKITFKSICDLFRIRDVEDAPNGFPYISPKLSPNFNNIWRFIHPPHQDASQNFYPNRNQEWAADIHLLANYVFISNDERRHFASEEQTYLIKETHTFDFLNITGSNTVEMHNRDMVPSFMFRFRRSDANLRNEWTNYTNWAYDKQLPVPPDNNQTALIPSSPWIFFYNCNHPQNIKEILIDMAILMDGKYREEKFPSGLWNYVEKYTRTTGSAKDGLYCYNFCLNSNQREYQPSGAINVSKFNKIQFQFNTIEPPINPEANFEVICDPSGVIIGVRKELWQQNDYNYDLRIWEERYNVIIIKAGRLGLKYAR